MKLIQLKLALFFCLFVFFQQSSKSQIYANDQNSVANWLCEECQVISPERAVDGNLLSYATIIQTASSFGAEIYLNIVFPTTAKPGEIVGVIVENIDFNVLDTTLLSSVTLTTFNDNVSNNDSRGSTDFNFYPLSESSSIHVLEFEASNAFNVIRFAMKGVNEGALDKINVFYAYFGSEPVPVELSLFKAFPKSSSIQLDWTTASESNNDYFSIERSLNAIDFEEIGIVYGAGNSSIDINYSFEDVRPIKGTAYYRLKQTDFDQKVKYFDILPITYTNTDFTFDIYPNPYFAGPLNIKFSKSDDIIVEIRNMAGEIILNTSLSSEEGMAEGFIQIETKMNPGVYFVTLITNSKAYVRKFIVS